MGGKIMKVFLKSLVMCAPFYLIAYLLGCMYFWSFTYVKLLLQFNEWPGLARVIFIGVVGYMHFGLLFVAYDIEEEERKAERKRNKRDADGKRVFDGT